MPGPSREWIAPLVQRWEACCAGEALVLSMPVYRPDLLETLARRLGLRYCDFRRSRLMPLGWNAASLPLDALDESAVEEMTGGQAVLLQNSEALLSLVTPAARKAWFASALARTWPCKLLLPIVLFAADLPDEAAGQIVTLDPGGLPAESLLDRLQSLA